MSLLDNNDFEVVYSNKRANHTVSSVDNDWLDCNKCIDTIRNTLFEAGWLFVNPYKVGSNSGGPMELGIGILQNAYVKDQGYMDFKLDTLGSLPHDEDNSGNITNFARVLLQTSGGLYQIPHGPSDPMIGGVPYGGPVIRTTVTFVGGIDVNLSSGTALTQVRGLSAYNLGAKTVGEFSGYQYFWFADRVGNGSVIGDAPVPEPDPGATRNGPGGFTEGKQSPPVPGHPRADAFVSAVLTHRLKPSWNFRREQPGLDGPGTFPDSDVFIALDWVARTGRSAELGTINVGEDDMTGTQGNGAVVFFSATTSGFYNGTWPSTSSYGGGWVMTNPDFTITVAITMIPFPPNFILFQFADSGSSIEYHHFFYGIVRNSTDYSIFGGDKFVNHVFAPPKQPIYRVIAGSHGFFVVDENNDPSDAFNCIAAIAPKLTQEQLDAGAIKSLLIVGPHNLNGGMTWDQIYSLSNDGGRFQTFKGVFTSVAGMCSIAFGFNYPLHTSNGRTFLQNAWIMAANNRDSDAQILGRVYDGMVLSGSIAQGYQFNFNGHTFVCVCSQGPGYDKDRPECSLWIAAD